MSPALADGARSGGGAVLAVGVDGVANVVLRLAPLVLELALGLVGAALDLGRLIVGGVAPRFLDLAAGLLEGALDAIGSKHDADTLKQWLTNPKDMAQKAGSTRKPPMLSFAKLPPPDVEALVAYLSTLKKAGK